MRRDRSLVPLSHQHHNALALCVLTDRSLTSDCSTGHIQRLAERIVRQFEIEISNHFELEEELLFPHTADAERLIAEHRRMESLVSLLRTSPSQELVRDFTALLRSHIRKEEGETFELLQATLPREALDTIGAALDARAVRVCLEPDVTGN